MAPSLTSAPTGADEGAGNTGGAGRPSRRRLLPPAEAATAVAASLVYPWICTTVDVDPVVRIGQVSGLGALQLYGALLGLPLLAVLLFTAHRGPLGRHLLVRRLVCAALAGLAGGVLAGGTVIALHGTPWPLGGQDGDPSTLVAMANSMMHAHHLPGVYPPGFPAAIALWAKLKYGGLGGGGFALHDLQIVCTALAGPAAYLAWRLLLRPVWALAIAVLSVITFLDPIRPYSHTAMIVLLPVTAAALRRLARAGELSTRAAVLRGAGYGAGFGALFLWYSGWFLWSAPGVLVLALAAFPWRAGRAAVLRALAFAGSAVAGFVAVGSPLLYELVRFGAGAPDRYAYLGVYADPGYVLGWATDRPGQLTYHNWPVPGELGGQTGIAVLLVVGAGLGVGLGLRHVAVRVAAATLAGSWLLRFWFVSALERTQTVQLYPRTTWIIMYCLIVLGVLGAMAAVQRGSALLRRPDGPLGGAVLPRTRVQLAAGLVCSLALFAAMGGSWSVNRYMPEDPQAGTMGTDAWRAHTVKKLDGSCPEHSPVKQCEDIDIAFFGPGQDLEDKLWCGALPTAEWPVVCGRPAPWTKG
ncbi:hypothetical protein [Kitasatospora cinereorecta]|uniref:hypothetical protein n=1 Tax=Kitasatospora cinereorecta TaxID=285560 RepID=UPI0031F972C1